MNTLKIFFWFSLILIVYTYFGYSLLLYILVKIKAAFKGKKPAVYQPHTTLNITLVIPAYNEEDFILQKIENTLALQYPPQHLKIIFITDGSTDQTPAIVSRFPQLTLMHNRERLGKIAAMNRVMQVVDTPFVVFCDANTLLNPQALTELMKHYTDPKVGGVAGEKKVMVNKDVPNAAASGEGLYWRYESALKRLDSQFYTIVGAAGELFSFRTALYEPVEEDTLLDDFMISLRICAKGYRVLYEPRAFATEAPSANISEEQKRKVRISAGGFQSIGRLLPLLNIFRYPKLSFQYISHRVLRWAVCPFLLPVVFLLNLWIVAAGEGLIYTLLLAGQVLFYLMAAGGWWLMHLGLKSRLLNFPYYFLFMNWSLYLGLRRYLRGSQSVTWDKAKRLA